MEVLSADTQATLLLKSRLGGSGAKPLTLAEYNRLARVLMDRKMRPGDLIGSRPADLGLDPERLERLISRGAALALSIEKWSQAGIRVVSRGESGYPTKLRVKLRANAAPLLYYSGNMDLTGSDAICIVGSRDATASGLDFAKRLGRSCAEEKLVVVSGAARGIDREAMDAASDAGGSVIGVVAETLLKAVLAKRNRENILQQRLLLVSPYDPEAPFTVAQAMDRNRYLYAFAEAAVVVDSDLKGGTWSGAVENQKHGWTPAYVRIGDEVGNGNRELVNIGLLPLSDDRFSPSLILSGTQDQKGADRPQADGLHPSDASQVGEHAEAVDASYLFDMFVARLGTVLGATGMTESALAGHFGLEAEQAKAWLQRCLDTGVVRASPDGIFCVEVDISRKRSD